MSPSPDTHQEQVAHVATASARAHHAGHGHMGHAAGHDQHAGHDPEMFRRRFWISLVLTIPLVVTIDAT